MKHYVAVTQLEKKLVKALVEIQAIANTTEYEKAAKGIVTILNVASGALVDVIHHPTVKQLTVGIKAKR